MSGPSVTAVVDDETWIVELTVRGVWERALWLTTFGLLNKCLSHHPAGLLLDLRDLHDPGAISAPLWLTAAVHGERMEPVVQVAACLPDRTDLSARLGTVVAARLVPTFPTVRLARSYLSVSRPRTERVRLHLPADEAAAARARHMVTAACEEWGMAPLVTRARLVVSELVVNAAEHAGTPIDVLISRRDAGRLLHLAVVDGSPALPSIRLEMENPLTERGYGLRIVDAAVNGWGALPTRTGKIVWALLKS
ncbi:ATP-binding protein [Actinoplanes sp. CA-252034]|uniref:ATP-binding protein n=1 Tax=Actinoplanes sp. CA-252034 TaxID=3239906 RepID=UPI003D988F6A